jgi:DNA-binding beta-propeller fold protein YncE
LYNISQVSGYPVHVTNANVGTGSGPANIAMTPSGQYVYVANNADGTVSEYAVTTNGFLTPIGVISAGTNPISIAVDPTGKYAYVANAGTNNVSQYLIGNNGVLSRMTPSTIAVNSLHPNSIAIDPSGKYAYVVTSGTVAQFTIGSSGALTPMSVAEVGGGISPSDIDIDSSGRYAYVPYALGVAKYDISSNGQLIRTNTQSVKFYPSKMVIDPDGSIYSANEKNNSVSKFDVVGDGSIVPALGGVSIGSAPISITTDAVR